MADTSVLLDLATEDRAWRGWSRAALDTAEAEGGGPLRIDPVVYAELSVRFAGPDDLDRFLAASRVVVAGTPRLALCLAARAHLDYRRRGGSRTGVLPDFFVGAHAAVVGARLITRDPGRVRTHFPAVPLVTPDGGGTAALDAAPAAP